MVANLNCSLAINRPKLTCFVVVVDFTTSTNHGHALELLDEYIDTFLRVQPGLLKAG